MIVYSANDEDFNYEDISEILNDYPDMKAGDTVYKAEAKRPDILKLIDCDDVVEQMCERAYDYGGEYAEDWCDSVENDKEAKKALDQSIKRWAKKYLPRVTFYSVGKSEEYILTEGDFK